VVIKLLSNDKSNRNECEILDITSRLRDLKLEGEIARTTTPEIRLISKDLSYYV